METIIKYRGRVSRIEDSHLVLNMEADDCCGGACGRRVCSNELRVSRPLDRQFSLGDRVSLSIHRNTMLKGAFWLYGVPVVATIIGAIAASPAGGVWSIVGAVLGFGLWLFLHTYLQSRHPKEPWILEA